MKRAAPKVALCAGSFALAFLGAELVLRFAGYDPMGAALDGRVELVRPSEFPGRGYELVPLARGQGWGTEVAINSRGFRGPEFEPEAMGRTRVIALGDSVTFGNDLAYESTWPAVLARELAVRGGAVDVLNLGLGGYDTAQEVATLEDLGLAFQPAEVVVAFCVNDLGIVSMSMESAFAPADRQDPLFVSRLIQGWHARGMERRQRRALYERNREEAYVRAFAAEIDPLPESLAAPLAALRARVAGAPAQEADLATRRIPPRWFASEARLGRLEHAFARLAGLGATHDFGVSLLLVPYLEDDALIQEGLALVRALAERHGFRIVDPRAAFLAEGLEHLHVRPEDPVHPNARGHALMAAEVGRALAETSLLGPESDLHE